MRVYFSLHPENRQDFQIASQQWAGHAALVAWLDSFADGRTVHLVDVTSNNYVFVIDNFIGNPTHFFTESLVTNAALCEHLHSPALGWWQEAAVVWLSDAVAQEETRRKKLRGSLSTLPDDLVRS